MAIRKPYRMHRQMHIGDMLDTLQRRGLLTWKWEHFNSTAYYIVTMPGNSPKRYKTLGAESLVQDLANEHRIVWIPVPPRGGVTPWEATVETIEKMKSGELPKPWEAPAS